MSSSISAPCAPTETARPGPPWLRVGAFLIAALVSLPVAVVLLNVLVPRTEIWAHLASTVLPEYVFSTLMLAALVAWRRGIGRGDGLGLLVLYAVYVIAAAAKG